MLSDLYCFMSQAGQHCCRIFPLLSWVIISFTVVSQIPLKFPLYLQFPNGVSKLTIWSFYSVTIIFIRRHTISGHLLYIYIICSHWGFPGGSVGRICLQSGRPGFDSWVGKIPQRREGLPTPVFWPGEFHGLYNPWGCKESDTTEQLSFIHSFIHSCSHWCSLPHSVNSCLFCDGNDLHVGDFLYIC